MKIVMTQKLCKEGLDKISKKAEYYIGEDIDPKKYLNELEYADAVIVRLSNFEGDVIRKCKNLKVIGKTGVGVDNIDVETATELGIPVVITPGANNRSVAEHTLAMILAASKNLCEYNNEIRINNWNIRDSGIPFEILNKKIGFIGLGAIGRETQKLCKNIGMKTAAYDPYVEKEKLLEYGVTVYKDYKEMIKDCDFISIHVPLNDNTKDMITLNELKSMKKSCILVNCSRGGIVNEDDLIYALKNNIIAFACLDTFEDEPLSNKNDLTKLKNTVLTPHSAAQTREAVINMAIMCIEGCFEVMNGKAWPYVANKEVFDNPKWKERFCG